MAKSVQTLKRALYELAEEHESRAIELERGERPQQDAAEAAEERHLARWARELADEMRC